MNKNQYARLLMQPIDIKIENPLLDGSLTQQTVKVNTVTVEPYSYGFEDPSTHTDAGFDVSFDN